MATARQLDVGGSLARGAAAVAASAAVAVAQQRNVGGGGSTPAQHQRWRQRARATSAVGGPQKLLFFNHKSQKKTKLQSSTSLAAFTPGKKSESKAAITLNFWLFFTFT